MKVALCLYGVVGNVKTKSGSLQNSSLEIIDISSKNYKKNIIEKNNVDVFIHSWSTDLKQEILEKFSPVSHKIEEQIVFDIPSHICAYGDANPEKRKQNHYSMWRSIKESVALKKDWEEKHGFEYDFVMIGRFDTSWETTVDFSSFDRNMFYTGKWCQLYNKNNVDVFRAGKSNYYAIENSISDPVELEKFRKSFTYRQKFDKNSTGLSCLWFFSNSKNMDSFSMLYDKIGEYCMPNRCPSATSNISSHKLSKYHLQQLGLEDKIKRVFHYAWDFPLIRRKYFNSKK